MNSNTISVITANYIAEHVNYNMTDGWMQGHQAMLDWYHPIETFQDRFDVLISRIRKTGFQAIDLYTGHLGPTWATPAHVNSARQVLRTHGVTVTSLAGAFGDTTSEVKQACLFANAIGARILSGNIPLLDKDPASVEAILEEHDLVLAIENHPEKTAREILERIPEGASERIGLAVDTGWLGTQQADVLKEMKALGDQILHVHLKDIRNPRAAGGSGYPLKDIGHETCPLGMGIVPVGECLEYLKQTGFQGPISFEHEPEDEDPTPAMADAYTYLSGKI